MGPESGPSRLETRCERSVGIPSGGQDRAWKPPGLAPPLEWRCAPSRNKPTPHCHTLGSPPTTYLIPDPPHNLPDPGPPGRASRRWPAPAPHWSASGPQGGRTSTGPGRRCAPECCTQRGVREEVRRGRGRLAPHPTPNQPLCLPSQNLTLMPHLAIPPSPCSMSSPCLTDMTSRKEMLPFSSLSDGCRAGQHSERGHQGSSDCGCGNALAGRQCPLASTLILSSSGRQAHNPAPQPHRSKNAPHLPHPQACTRDLALSFTVPRAPPCRRPLQRLKHRNSPCISEHGNYPQTWLGPLCHLPRTLHEGRRGQGDVARATVSPPQNTT